MYTYLNWVKIPPFLNFFRSYLELNVLRVLLDLDALCVLPPGLQQEVLNLLDLARHRERDEN